MKKVYTSLEKYFDKKFSKKITVNNITETKGGFLSKAFIVDITDEKGIESKLFLRSIKSNDGGYSYDVDRMRVFVISDEMYRNSNSDIKSYGVKSIKDGELITDFEISDKVEHYHIQSFVKGTLYSEKTSEFKNKEHIDNTDKLILSNIANKIGKIHNQKVTSNKDNQNIYQRGFQEIIINPEITVDILSCFPDDHKYFGKCDFRYDYIKKIFMQYDEYRSNKNNRKVSYLHGDFWDANILVNDENDIFLIDFSRIPYGDAGIDIGWFVGNLLLSKIITGNETYIEAAKYFVDEYINATGDKDIMKYTLMSFLWLGIINLFPPVFGNKPEHIAQEIMDKIFSDIEKGEMILA